MTVPLLTVESLGVSYPVPAGLLARLAGRAPPPRPVVHGLDLAVAPGEVLALVGESGSGKSTTAMAIMRLQHATAGHIRFQGADITAARGPALMAFRRRAQLVFQDPYQSINPRFTVLQAVAEPLAVHRIARGRALRERALDSLAEAGLPGAAPLLDRPPAALSGGQRQRVAIARAMILEPALLVADEPVSMLDVSIRAGVLRLLKSLATTRGLGILYISHDIATVRYLADRTIVLYRGRAVETGPTRALLASPRHPYTAALVAAVPRMGAARPRVALASRAASSEDACPFLPRCPAAFARCATERPPLRPIEPGRTVACHLAA